MRPLLANALILSAIGVVSACFVVGCTTTTPRAIVNDMSLPKEFDSGYRVVAVDGKTVNRAKGKDKTTAPVAILEAGKRTITVQSPADPEPVKMEATLEPFKQYRIASGENGKPKLVEFTHYPERDHR